MINKELLGKMVRYGSNWPLSIEGGVGEEKIGVGGSHIQEKKFPKAEGGAYLLGVISRALRSYERGKGKEDTEVFLSWLAQEVEGEDEFVYKDREKTRDLVGRWLLEGEEVLQGQEED